MLWLICSYMLFMERLVTREGIESYQKNYLIVMKDFIKFYMTVKKAFLSRLKNIIV